MPENLETIVEFLREQVDEEVVELGEGGKIVSKVVNREAVAEILHFGKGKDNSVQKVLEGTDFFQVKSNNEQ